MMKQWHNWLMPKHISPMARAQMPREMLTWALLSLALGVIEGGVLAVIVKIVFTGVVSDFWLHQAVALVAGAPAFANLSSLYWASASHGKHKIRFLTVLQMLTVISILLSALSTASTWGLIWFLFTMLIARFSWSGVITLRATVWRANFPREIRATLAGKLTAVSAILMSLSGMFTGWMMDSLANSFHYIYPVAALTGMIGVSYYRKIGMRGHKVLLNKEQSDQDQTPVAGSEAWKILKSDTRFRNYMMTMFIFGSGNLMVTAPLVLILHDQGYSSFNQMLISASIPLAVIPWFVPIWAKKLDGMHIIPFRVFHSWFFVLSHLLFALGAWLQLSVLFWAASFVLGIAYAGGLLGWNLGHHDFAPPEKAAQYMGIHVFLTGARGLITPFIGVNLYEFLKEFWPDQAYSVLFIPWLLCLSGALLFLKLRKQYLQADFQHPRPHSATAPVRSSPSSSS